MPLNLKAKLAKEFRGKTAQEIQDEIFRKMSADKKLEVAAKLWMLARELDKDKVDFRKHGRNRPPSSFDTGCRDTQDA